MSDYSKNGTSKESPSEEENNHAASLEELVELRSLLFGIEPEKLNKLYERLDNPQILPQDISRMLPEAVILRAKQDKQLSEAVVSTVEEAIDISVKQDQNNLADALFPIIGPATRKAISAALDEMIQSFNVTLENSLSPESFQWRLEAARTGKTFAEIVLLRNLIYRVEQVFLIHKQTGLLLHHILASNVAAQDPDLVSAMLTAIQDFVKDSFRVQKNDALQSLEFGDLTIWIEEGPQAVIAGIIRGNAPQELKLVFQDAIEKIHLKLSTELKNFNGDSELFATSKGYLSSCLEARYKKPPETRYTYAWVFLGTIALGLGLWGFFAIREQLHWNSFVDKLKVQSGIVVVESGKKNGKYFLSGMRDPLAVDPESLMQKSDIQPETVVSSWKPFIALDSELIVKRAELLLRSPKTVTLQIDENGILEASGYASREWVSQARKSWRYIPGVTQFQDDNIQDISIKELEKYKKEIEEENLLFLENSTNIVPSENKKIPNLISQMQKLVSVANQMGKEVKIEIKGHTNTTGTEDINMPVSENRAKKVLSYLVSQGLESSIFNAVGVGTRELLQSESFGRKEAVNRRVSFKVFLKDKRK